jgi:DNA-binding beta-propeller fold protein YncE
MPMRLLDAFRARLRRVGPVLGLAALVGCYRSGDGSDPDDAHPYFPVGLAVSDSGKWLFVANSNFDLRFNAGTVQALDLGSIVGKARACGARLEQNLNDPCKDGEDARPFSKASVRIGAFAADLRATARYDAAGARVADAGRLLLPIRGDASLTAIDFEESAGGIKLRCEGNTATTGTRCGAGWRLGTDPNKSERQLTLEGEPFSLALPEWNDTTKAELTRVGGLAAIVHQSSGNVSLFVDAARDTGVGAPAGKLAYVLGGVIAGGTGIAALDAPGGYPRFLVTNRTRRDVAVVRYFPDEAQYGRSALVLEDLVDIPPQASGFDTRGIVVDPPAEGESRPTRVFLSNRTPAALVVGQVDPKNGNKLTFYENVALPVGPSRLVRASIGGKTLILIASFDARAVVVYDPDARKVTNVLRTHRGPYAMAVDPVSKLGFVCNFTDSTVQVIELDPARAGKPDYQRVIYSVGVPSGPTR